MNKNCKYCDYISKCSRRCEYDSILCRLNRSFPKIIDKSYEDLQQENKKQKEVIDRLIELNQIINNSDYVYSQDEITTKNLDILKEVSE